MTTINKKRSKSESEIQILLDVDLLLKIRHQASVV